MPPLTDSALVPYSLHPLHCSPYSLCCLLSCALSQSPYMICKQKHQRQSFALALSPSHTHTHTVLQTFCLSKNQFQVCNVFFLFPSLLLVSSLLLGRSPFGAFYMDFGHTVTYKLNLPELPDAVSVSQPACFAKNHCEIDFRLGCEFILVAVSQCTKKTE